MTTYYLRLALLPILLLTAVLLVIRSKPYDDRELRELLLPTDCPAPCFMGIRPGVTTMEEAVAILGASGWVEVYDYVPDVGFIRLRWSDQSPVWLTNDGTRGSTMWVTNGVIDTFMIDTTLTPSEFLLTFGTPERQYIQLVNLEAGSYLLYSAFYTDFGLSVVAQGNCDGKRKNITYNDYLYLSYRNPFNDTSDTYTEPSASWIDVLRTKCQTY